jgi:hypothetical protein
MRVSKSKMSHESGHAPLPGAPVAAAAPGATATPPPKRSPWRPSRGTLIFAGAMVVYAGARLWDWAALQRERALVLGRAHRLATVAMPDGGAPRRVVVLRNPAGLARYQYDTFVKPVLDAAALEVTYADARDPAEARTVAAALDLVSPAPPADGVVVLGTTLLRGVRVCMHACVRSRASRSSRPSRPSPISLAKARARVFPWQALLGLVERQRAVPSEAARTPLTFGYVPLWHANALARVATQFSEARMFRYAHAHIIPPPPPSLHTHTHTHTTLSQTSVRPRHMG